MSQTISRLNRRQETENLTADDAAMLRKAREELQGIILAQLPDPTGDTKDKTPQEQETIKNVLGTDIDNSEIFHPNIGPAVIPMRIEESHVRHWEPMMDQELVETTRANKKLRGNYYFDGNIVGKETIRGSAW